MLSECRYTAFHLKYLLHFHLHYPLPRLNIDNFLSIYLSIFFTYIYNILFKLSIALFYYFFELSTPLAFMLTFILIWRDKCFYQPGISSVHDISSVISCWRGLELLSAAGKPHLTDPYFSAETTELDNVRLVLSS